MNSSQYTAELKAGQRPKKKTRFEIEASLWGGGRARALERKEFETIYIKDHLPKLIGGDVNSQTPESLPLGGGRARALERKEFNL